MAIDQGRRRTLAWLGAGATGLGLAANTPARAQASTQAGAQASASPRSSLRDPSDLFGVAIVGFGGYGALSAQRLRDARLARPAAIVTGSPDRARAAAQGLGVPPDAIYGYEDYDRIAADDRIAAVHICLPVGLHAQHALRALAAGKHVLCEKPLASTAAEARNMAEAARTADRLLMPAYRAWFSPTIQEALRRVRAGEHGALVSVDAHKGFAIADTAASWRFDPALAGAGCLFDIGTYSVQLQRWFAGGLPIEVGATAHGQGEDPRFGKVESDIAWWARFENGVLATGSASWRYRIQNRVRAGCARAWLDIDPATPAMGERLRVGTDGPTRIEEVATPLRDQIPLMYDAFAEACLGRRDIPVPAQDGIDDLVMMEAILRAAGTGRSVTLA